MNVTEEDYGLDYDLDDYQSIEEVSNKILEINLKKTNVLEKYKNSDKTLPVDIYNATVENINDVFDGYLAPLEIRRQKILSEIVLEEQTACKLDKLTTIKRTKIKNVYQLKLSRFENYLYKKQCRMECRIGKVKALAQFKTIYPVSGTKIKITDNPFIITDGRYRPP